LKRQPRCFQIKTIGNAYMAHGNKPMYYVYRIVMFASSLEMA